MKEGEDKFVGPFGWWGWELYLKLCERSPSVGEHRAKNDEIASWA